jgi:hypothetical protein
MKTLFTAIAFLLAAFSLPAQTNNAAEKYIEVMAEDTLLAQPDYYEYSIKVIPYSENEDLSSGRDIFQMEKEQREASNANEKLLQVLRNRKIHYEKAQDAAFVKTPGPANAFYEYTLKFTHIKQLSGFFDEIKDMTQFESYISLSKSSKSDMYEKMLLEKVIKKAGNKAAILAQAAGVKLAGITQIREVEPAEKTADSVSPGWVVYPPLSALPPTMAADFLQITYRKSLIIRFAIEN